MNWKFEAIEKLKEYTADAAVTMFDLLGVAV